MKSILFIVTLLISLTSLSQITITNITTHKETPKVYDSLYNHPDDDVIIGQTLIFTGGSLFGDLLYKDYNQSKYDSKNVIDKNSILLNEFIVIGVLSGKYYDNFYQLLNTKTKDTIYFLTDRYSFPFVCVGYYEKQKQLYINKKYVFNKEVSENLSFDINTGDTVNNKEGIVWKCVDFTITNSNYSMVFLLENNEGQVVKVDNNFFGWKNEDGIWEEETVKKYKTKFGITTWNKILEGKVSIGMTKEMVELSWGSPNKINKSSYSEQWVYDNQYLYFSNGKLTDFN